MLILGDSFEKLKELPDNSVDSIVTDPPYGFAFMGKKWDYELPRIEIWQECLRVLKPGGHLLAFGGPRTYHRMACGVEDAGFEIRDQLQWLFGSGFPKSLNISKAIDKQSGIIEWKETNPNPASRPGNGKGATTSTGWAKPERPPKPVVETDKAKEWDGWGTALKPANEPIVLARKPLSEKTVAENVLKWGTGGLNIDASRIEAKDQGVLDAAVKRMTGNETKGWKNNGVKFVAPVSAQGRFPANLILDEEAAEMLDQQSGQSVTRPHKTRPEGNENNLGWKNSSSGENFTNLNDSGGASRFFYCAKVSTKERNAGCEDLPVTQTLGGGGLTSCGGKFGSIKAPAKNNHPTVKPKKLMAYLIKLITPPGGTVLDPFMGSGSTGVAAKEAGFQFIGIEREAEYFEIANKRILK